jgi:hypothetical protein
VRLDEPFNDFSRGFSGHLLLGELLSRLLTDRWVLPAAVGAATHFSTVGSKLGALRSDDTDARKDAGGAHAVGGTEPGGADHSDDKPRQIRQADGYRSPDQDGFRRVADGLTLR